MGAITRTIRPAPRYLAVATDGENFVVEAQLLEGRDADGVVKAAAFTSAVVMATALLDGRDVVTVVKAAADVMAPALLDGRAVATVVMATALLDGRDVVLMPTGMINAIGGEFVGMPGAIADSAIATVSNDALASGLTIGAAEGVVGDGCDPRSTSFVIFRRACIAYKYT